MVDNICILTHELLSICKPNGNNVIKLEEELKMDNENLNESLKVEYMYNNSNDLSQNLESLNTLNDPNKHHVLMNGSFCSVSPNSSKESMLTSFNHQVEANNSRRRQTFKCPYCPKIFCNSSAIAKHKLTHSDERKYVCDICGKAFKRQDHLNGHKYTHKVNKPHACFFCDRSYSDARSLKRHYENQHQEKYKEKMAARDFCGSSVDDNGCPASIIDSFGFFDDHISVKCEVCDRGFKNQSALNGHMRLHGGYGQTKNFISGPGETKLPTISMLGNSVENKISSDKQQLQIISTSKINQNSDLNILNSESTSVTPPQSPPTLLPASSSKRNLSSVPQMDLASLVQSPTYERCITPDTVIGTDLNKLPNVSIEDLRMVFQPISIQERQKDQHSPMTSSKTPPANTSKRRGQYFTYSPQQLSTELPSNTKVVQDVYSEITSSFGNKNTNSINSVHDQTLFSFPAILENAHMSDTFTEDYLTTIHYDKFQTEFTTPNLNPLGDNKSWHIFDSSIHSHEMPDYNNSNSSMPLKSVSSSSNNNLQEILMNLDNLSDSNEIINNPCSSNFSEETMWSHYHEDFQNTTGAATNCVLPTSKFESMNLLKPAQSTMITVEDKRNDSVSRAFLPDVQDAATPLKKSKIRPPPIFIPPQTSAHMSRLRSPRVWNMSESVEYKIPPYTPPPMLSPQRKGSGLFNTVRNSSLRNSINSANSFGTLKTSLTTVPITGLSDSSSSFIGDSNRNAVFARDSPNDKRPSQCDVKSLSVVAAEPAIHSSISDARPLSAFIRTACNSIASGSFQAHRAEEPQYFLYQDEYIDFKSHSLNEIDGLPTSATPRINIGPEYQAELPTFSPDRQHGYSLREYDTLLWNPSQFNETGENISSLNLLMKIAKSPAIKSCGLNMEYTFHLLFKYEGDFERTLQALLEESFVVYGYVYAETSNWTSEEICKFQERLKAHDRDFLRVSLDLQSYGMNKSVKACVEFYYVRKYMNGTKDVYLHKSSYKSRKKLTTRNCTPVADDDANCRPPLLDPYCPVAKEPENMPYNLRRKYNSENEKQPRQVYYYESKSSGSSPSREHSPSSFFEKAPKIVSVGMNNDTIKKGRSSYQCSQCNRSFAKLKTLENHIHNYVHKKRTRNKMKDKDSERTPEPPMYR